jgi:hypothetical protein
MVDSSKVIADEVLKLTNKLTTRELALKTIYPDMDEAAIQDLIKKIDAETQANIAKNQALLEQQGQQDPDQAQEGQEPGAPQPPKAGKKAPPFAKKAAPVGAKA